MVKVPFEQGFHFLFLLPGLALAESRPAALPFRSQENVVLCPHPRAAAPSHFQPSFLSPTLLPSSEDMEIRWAEKGWPANLVSARTLPPNSDIPPLMSH